jgi:hypothetical protein
MTSAELIAAHWFERMLEGYPSQTAQFVSRERDRFRNPVGHSFRQALGVLAEEVLGAMDPGRMAPALDEIVRIRAVQDFTAAEAVGFVFLLREVLAAEPPPLPAPNGHVEDAGEVAGCQLQRNVDALALMAFDAYMRCREEIAAIRGREAWRSPSGVSRDECGS